MAGLTAVVNPSVSTAYDSIFKSPSDHVVRARINDTSDDEILAPTATRQLTSASYSPSTGAAAGCCDNSYSYGCCDGMSGRPGLLSRLFGFGSCDGLCDQGCGHGGCGLGSMGCDGGCDGLGCDSGLLGYGIVKRSERCFDDFISPMTNPIYFEDPRTLTEVRFLFLHHRLPNALGGNSVQVYAAQFRVALSERLSFIATKDGLIYTQSPLFDSGFADVNAGFKYNFYRDPQAGRLLSGGITYEIPMGSNRSLQGLGDGEFNFFLTGGTRLMGSPRAHWLSAGGLRQPLDESAGNRMAYWSNHVNYMLNFRRPTYVFTEVNWWHYLSDGDGVPVLGGDLFNLGSPNASGSNLVSQAVGVRVKPRRNVEVGSAYEFPVSRLDGVLKDRWTMDLIIRY